MRLFLLLSLAIVSVSAGYGSDWFNRVFGGQSGPGRLKSRVAELEEKIERLTERVDALEKRPWTANRYRYYDPNPYVPPTTSTEEPPTDAAELSRWCRERPTTKFECWSADECIAVASHCDGVCDCGDCSDEKICKVSVKYNDEVHRNDNVFWCPSADWTYIEAIKSCVILRGTGGNGGNTSMTRDDIRRMHGATWPEAKKLCGEAAAQLAEIHDRQKQEILVRFLKELEVDAANPLDGIWVGGEYWGEPGEELDEMPRWRWTASGMPITFNSNWIMKPKQPDNLGPMKPDREECKLNVKTHEFLRENDCYEAEHAFELNAKWNFQWNDRRTTRKQMFLCETRQRNANQ